MPRSLFRSLHFSLFLVMVALPILMGIMPTAAEGTLQLSAPPGGNWQWRGGGCFEESYFIDDDHGWAVGSRGTIVHTTDGGLTWWPQENAVDAEMRSVHFASTLQGWAVGASPSTILHTTDGGLSWLAQNSSTWAGLNAVYFVDALNGWAAGEGGAVTPPMVAARGRHRTVAGY